MHPVETKLLTAWPGLLTRKARLVLAVSGGADSVALLQSLHRIRMPDISLVVAHFNHKLRGNASDADERLVADMARELGLEFHRGCRSVVPNSEDDLPSDEATLRQDRYGFFERICALVGARYLVTAHSADDQVETILFRLFRGSGNVGLAGIDSFRSLRPHSDIVLARPMLSIYRSEILDYLQVRNIHWREDASNELSHYSRNWIRNHLMPDLEIRFGSGVKKSILQAGKHQRELRDLIDDHALQLREDSVCLVSPKEIRLKRAPLATSLWPVCHRLLWQLWQEVNWPLRSMSSESWYVIRDRLPLDEEPTESTTLPGNVRLRVETDWVSLTREEAR